MNTPSVHLSINLKSHRAGLVNDLMSHRRRFRTVDFRTLHSAQQPATSYGIYHRVWGKYHSANPKF